MDPANYRPITVSLCLLRLLTIRMCKNFNEVVESKGMIGEEQFGFRRGRSTHDAGFVLSTLLWKAKLKRKPYAAAFVDIKKV